MNIVFEILEKSLWAGVAGLGFGILFNIPKKTRITVFVLGAIAGLIKFTMLQYGAHIVLATFLASLSIGIISIRLAHIIHYPPAVFAVPPMIPMIPGFFAYQFVIGVLNYLFDDFDSITIKLELLTQVFQNLFTMIFILIALILGVSLPMLVLRKNTVKG